MAFCEIEKFPCRLLEYRFPQVPNLGDINNITETDIINLGHIDVVIFGSPCQDLSIGGKQAGLAGLRSGLFFKAVQIIDWAIKHCGCRFALWENVKGAFRTNRGDDFTAVVRNMAGCRNIVTPENGWGTEGVALGDKGLLEWCVLDSQWFGLAQRRKRVFVVASANPDFDPTAVLFESDSLRRNTPPCREAGQETTGTVTARTSAGGGLGDFELNGGLTPVLNFTNQHSDHDITTR